MTTSRDDRRHGSLDQTRYENDVVKPLRRRVHDLPDDLPTRYAVDETVTQGDLELRLHEVRAYWDSKARTTGAIGTVCQAFLREDETLRAEHGDALADLGWWRARQQRPPAAAEEPPTRDPAPVEEAPEIPEPREHTDPAPETAGDENPPRAEVEVARAPAPGATAPPDRLQHRHRGGVVRLSWVWPEGARVAVVSWPGGHDRVTRSRYDDEGGFALPAEVRGRVEVRTVTGRDRRESAPSTIDIAAPPRTVPYRVRMEGSRRRGDLVCVFSLDPEEHLYVKAVVVASSDRTMPTAVRREEIVDGDAVLAPGTETRVRCHLPHGPGWVRCFPSESDVVLLDPPVDQLWVP